MSRDKTTGRFLTGNKGGGRPTGSRNKFAENFLEAAAAEWEAGGRDAMTKMRVSDPSAYVRTMASILPRDVFLSVQQEIPGNLDADDWAALRSLLSMIREANVIASPGEVATILEDALRSHFAKLITTSSDATPVKTGT